MKVRILHCGESKENYDYCLINKVLGFSKNMECRGDLVYLCVKIDGISLCGARGKIGEKINCPQQFSDNFKYWMKYYDIELCTPFNINILRKVGGSLYGVKYLQGAKAIKDKSAIDLLNNQFAMCK